MKGKLPYSYRCACNYTPSVPITENAVFLPLWRHITSHKCHTPATISTVLRLLPAVRMRETRVYCVNIRNCYFVFLNFLELIHNKSEDCLTLPETLTLAPPHPVSAAAGAVALTCEQSWVLLREMDKNAQLE